MVVNWVDTDPVLLDACPEGRRWARRKPSLQAAWAMCKRGEWMLWYISKRISKGDIIARRRLVIMMCNIGRLVLQYTERNKECCLRGIELAEKWANGDNSITTEMLQEATEAVYNSGFFLNGGSIDLVTLVASRIIYLAINPYSASRVFLPLVLSPVHPKIDAYIANKVREYYPQPP